MAGDYSRKIQSDNKHLANITSARFVHVDGSKAQVIVRPAAGRLLRAVINTAGINAIVRDGSNVIGNISTTMIGTLDYGIYVSTNITVDVVSGNGSITFVCGD